MMILEEAGAKYECKTPDDRPPVTFAPPMIMTPSGAQVGQSPVIACVLGRELGLWPTDVTNDMKALQYCADAADAFADFMSKDSSRMERWFAHFEGALQLSGGKFLFGDTLTAADYMC